MLTKRTLFYIRKSFEHSQYCCLHPFLWNKNTNMPDLTTSRIRLTVWYLNVIFGFCYYFYVLGTCVHLNMSDKPDESQEKIFMTILSFYFLLPLSYHLTFLTDKESFSGLTRLLLRHSNDQAGEFLSITYT